METKLSLRVPLKSKSKSKSASEPAIPELCGLRLADLSSNLIAFTSQLLSARFADARWWAADSGVRSALTNSSPTTRAYAAERLGGLLRAGIYHDLWVADATGMVVAQAKPGGYCYLRKTSVSGEGWFRDALDGRGRNSFHGIQRPDAFVGHTVAVYGAPIREGSLHEGKIVGALGLFVDWQKQSQLLIDGVRIPPDEREFSRSMILDANNRIVASTGQRGVLQETFPLRAGHNSLSGSYSDGQGHLVGFARSLGGEEMFGHWHAVIEQGLQVARRPLHVAARGYGAGHMISMSAS